MPDFADIRRGLAANLANALHPHMQVSPYLLDNPMPPSVQVAGITAIDYDITFQGANGYDLSGDRFTIIVEAALPPLLDITAQQLLDDLHGSALSLKGAIESDPKLTSRFLDDQTVTSGHPNACDALRVSRYLGAARYHLNDRGEVLLATWEIDLIT